LLRCIIHTTYASSTINLKKMTEKAASLVAENWFFNFRRRVIWLSSDQILGRETMCELFLQENIHLRLKRLPADMLQHDSLFRLIFITYVTEFMALEVCSMIGRVLLLVTSVIKKVIENNKWQHNTCCYVVVVMSSHLLFHLTTLLSPQIICVQSLTCA
jgi:hypothetical protein